MFSLTEEQSKQFKEQAEKIIENAAEGMSTRDIMAGIYAENIDGKTIEEGEAVADRILEAVKNFDSDYGEAKKDTAAFVKKFRLRVSGDKSRAENCTYWLKFIAALSALNSEKKIDSDYIKGLHVSESEATVEYEQALEDEAETLLMENGIMLSGLVEYAKNAEIIADGNAAAELLLSFGENEVDFRGIGAMLVYSQIQSGEIKNVPDFITPEQITAITCAEVEREKIFEGIRNGSVGENVAAEALKAIGDVVVISCVSAFLAMCGLGLMPTLIISIAAVNVLEAIFPRLPNDIARIGSLAVSDIVYGARRIAYHAENDMLPKIKSTAEKAQKKFAEKLERIGEKTADVQYDYDEENVILG